MADSPFADLIPTPGAKAGQAANPFADLMPAPTLEPGKDGGPKRLVMDMSGKPDKGIVDATARGVAKGVTANFGDEIRGLVEAGGANPDDPASVYKLISGALKYWGGDEEAKKTYDATVTRERELDKTAQEQHPIASTIGEVGGAVALPAGRALQGGSLMTRSANSAAVGAGYGALAGAGEGVGAADTISRGTMGGGLGFAAGGAAPAVLETIGAAGRGIARAAEPFINTFRGFRDPDAEAARRVVGAVRRDVRNQGAGLTPGEFAGARAEGQPVTMMDMGGETTRALARSAANTSPEGRAVLDRTINDRFEGQSGRLTDWLNRNFSFPNAHAQRQAIDEVERTVNRAGYLRAYRDGADLPFDEELLQISQAPVVQDAIRKAMVTAKNEAAKLGLTPPKNPFRADDSGWFRPMAAPDGSFMRPSLQFWDVVKKNLDRTATQESRDWARVLREHLDGIVPSYKTARGGAAHFFGAENALEAGENFVAQSFGNRQAREALAKMTPLERQLFQDGFASRYIETVNRSPDRRSILNKIANSPEEKEKLEIALGAQKAKEMETFLRVEGIMDLARGAVQGNSTTVRQLVEAGLAGGLGYGGATGDWSPQSLFTAAFVGGMARGVASRANQRIDQNVARRVADMLASPDPAMLRRGVALVTHNPRYLEALRNADISIARAASNQVPTGGAVQSAAPGRAENDQPGIYGPL